MSAKAKAAVVPPEETTEAAGYDELKVADYLNEIIAYLVRLVRKHANPPYSRRFVDGKLVKVLNNNLEPGYFQELEESLVFAEQDTAELISVARTHAEAFGPTRRHAFTLKTMDSTQFKNINEAIGYVGGRKIPTELPPVFSEFLEKKYIPEVNLRSDAQRHIEGYARLFIRIVGDKPLADYNRDDIVKWVRTLERLPRTYGKSPKDHTTSIETLLKQAERTKAQTLSRTTIEKHVTHIKAMFLKANTYYRFEDNDYIKTGLFEAVAFNRSTPKAQKRKSWTVEKLNALFSTSLWTGTRSRLEDRTKRHEAGPQIHIDAYWWLPIIALHSGMRLEEIAQLQHEDLQFDKTGIAFFRIHDEGDREVKTDHSIRNIPVHPFLIELGILKLFQARKTGRVWKELKKHGRPPSFGALYSSHFTDYRKAVKLYENLLDFHSLRRTAITMLRTRCDVDALTVAAIAGHDDSDEELRKVQQTDDYTDYSIEYLHGCLSKLDYEKWGVDFSAIRKAAQKCGPRGSMRI